MTRMRLPGRRLCLTDALVTKAGVQPLSVGFDRAGVVREVFVAQFREGSDTHLLMDDACVLVSLLLQRGMAAAELVDRLGTVAGDPSDPAAPPRPASLIGRVVAQAAAIEAQSGAMVRYAYALVDA